MHPHGQRRRYLQRLSGPLLDRVDLQVEVPAVTRADLALDLPRESTAVVAARVADARATARERLRPLGLACNADLSGQLLRGELALPRPVVADIDRALERGRLTVRGYDRVLRISWTEADLDGAAAPGRDHVARALLLRQLSRVAGMSDVSAGMVRPCRRAGGTGRLEPAHRTG